VAEQRRFVRDFDSVITGVSPLLLIVNTTNQPTGHPPEVLDARARIHGQNQRPGLLEQEIFRIQTGVDPFVARHGSKVASAGDVESGGEDELSHLEPRIAVIIEAIWREDVKDDVASGESLIEVIGPWVLSQQLLDLPVREGKCDRREVRCQRRGVAVRRAYVAGVHTI